MATKKTKTTVKKPHAVKAKTKITPTEIQLRAQEIYNKRVKAGIHGDELSDWLQAEEELKTN